MNYSVPNHEKRDLTPEEVLSDVYGEVASRMEKPIQDRPFYMFGGILALGLMVVTVRVFWLAVSAHDVNANIAESNRKREIVISAPRGIIFDRLGKPLTQNIPAVNVVAYPADLPQGADDRIREAEALGQFLSFSEVKRHELVVQLSATSDKPLLLSEYLPRDTAILFEANRSQFPGISLEVVSGRAYGDGEANYHILGLLGRVTDSDAKAGYLVSDLVGKSGIEASYQTVLNGIHGRDVYEVNSRGAITAHLTHDDPKEGGHLVLSMDGSLQSYIYRALQNIMKARGSGGGAVVALDPRDGRILALVSAPSVDANILAKGLTHEEYQLLQNDERHPFFNRAIASRYPAGSTIKPFMAAAALTEKIVTPKTVIQDNGSIAITSVYDPSVHYVFHGYATLGPVNLYSAIAKSSDIYFYTVGGGYGSIKGLGAEKIATYLGMYGFGARTGIDIPGENEGLVPTSDYKLSKYGEPWRIGDTYNISIGQGDIGVTPLQLAVATAAIANRGTLWQPQLALRTVDKEFNTLKVYEPRAIRRDFIPAEHTEEVRKAMRQTVTDGSGRLLLQLPVTSAAKTGTAQTGAITSPYHALVTVFAPYENPEIVLAIIVEKGGQGNEVAVPLARDILTEYFTAKQE